jgi:hypothetical protein
MTGVWKGSFFRNTVITPGDYIPLNVISSGGKGIGFAGS